MRLVSSLHSVALLAAAQLLHGVSSSPVLNSARPLARAPSDPGMGVELEVANVVLKNPKVEGRSSDADFAKVKGAVIDRAEDTEVGWRRTAETTSSNDISTLNVEWIVDGLVCKLGQNMVQPAVAGVVADLNRWQPQQNAPEVPIAGFDPATDGTWSIQKPSRFYDAAITFSQQVTVPLPLEAINDMACQAQGEGTPNAFVTAMVASKRKRLQCVRAEMFTEKLGKVDPSPDLMGFMSLVLSYAKNTQFQDPGASPKTLITIMPRTDFAAMYSMVAPRLQEQLNCRSLYDVVKILAEYEASGTGKDSFWKVSDDDGRTASEMDRVQFTFPKGQSLKISDWINDLQNKHVDDLAEKDKLIDAQIGKLGARTESLLGNPARQVPILELRDLGGSTAGNNGAGLKAAIQGFEDAAVQMHHTYKNPPLALRAPSRASPVPNACPVSAPQTTPQTTPRTATSTPATTTPHTPSTTSHTTPSGSQAPPTSTRTPAPSSMRTVTTHKLGSSSAPAPVHSAPTSNAAPPKASSAKPSPSKASQGPTKQPSGTPPPTTCKRETTLDIVMRKIGGFIPHRGGGGRSGSGSTKLPPCK